MTAPSPKPIADCPNPECRSETELKVGHHAGSWVMCMKCEYCGPIVHGAEQWQNAEAIRLHNLLCRPQQSAEPVAYRVAREPFQIEKDGEPFEYSTKYMNGLWQPLFAASPWPSELVEEMEKLVNEWRAEAELHPLKTLAPGGVCPELALEKCADRLSALITRHRGKS